MTDHPQDETSVKGRGPEIMLPPRGNPFTAMPEETPSAAEAALPLGEETAGAPEPRDLSPEDLAALFPTSHAEREAPAAEAGAEPSFASSLGADLEIPGHSASAEAEPSAAGLSPEDLAALFPSAPEARGAGGESVPPGARPLPDVPITAPGMAIPATTVVGGQALPGTQAFAGGLQISEDLGITPEAYQRAAALPGREALVNMFVPDSQLVALWAEIDSIETTVTATPHLSLQSARELLDRLATARNYLMNDRANYEEAGRELAEVKYRLGRLRRSAPTEHPRAILAYLLLFLGLIILGFAMTESFSARVGLRIAGGDFGLVWTTVLWGGIGGVTGALYALWRHVARDQDYEPQYALWYYSNPMMGVILGAFVYLVVQLSLPALLAAGQSDTLQASPYILYLLAWAVGFQQNLAFSLANYALKRLIPAEEKGKSLAVEPGAGGEAKVGAPPTFPAAKK
jgi:hypothetical protein